MYERYLNTQRGFLRPLLASLGIAFLVLAYFFGLGFLLPALLMYLLSFLFGQITIEERGDHLSIRFGPLALIRQSIRYTDILSYELLHNCGIGIKPSAKGWVWSVGGQDCVRISTRRRSLVVSTDDPNGLVEHLDSKMKARQLIQDAPAGKGLA